MLQHPAQFDIVTCMEMLEHVPDPASVISACAELVKPGGTVFFSTINRNAKAYMLAIVGAEYLLRILPKGTHDYAKFIRPSEMESWARHAGLKMHDLTGMTYNPLNQHYSLGRDLDVNYLAHCTRDDADLNLSVPGYFMLGVSTTSALFSEAHQQPTNGGQCPPCLF